MKTMSRNAVLLTLFYLAMPLAARDREGDFERTFTVSAAPEIDVTTESGNIDVRPGSDSAVHVRGHIRVNHGVSAEEAERIIQKLTGQPPIEQDGNHVRIGFIKDWSLGGFISLSFDRHPFSISYEVVAPASARLRLQTGSGDQRIAGLKGAVDATAGSGNLKLSNLGGGVRALAGSGSIEVAGAAGNVDLQTGSGNLRVVGVAGRARLHTGSGNLALEGALSDAIEVETGSGDAEIRCARGTLRAHSGSGSLNVSGAPGGDWKLKTGSGDVTLHVPPQASFEFDARSGSGSIESKRALTMTGKAFRNQVRGTVGSGGPLVSVRTGSGSIRFEV
jgi:DUF4097 and DUF4098 domain-containing protein YvlB